jgi:microcystin-dependent protein
MNPFVGEIRLFAGNFPPQGWAFCDGSLLPISEFETLFSLIGTTYGGDGQENYALPDLRGRVPVHQGTGPGGTTWLIGQAGGTETVTLTAAQLPTHSHGLVGSSSAATSSSPAGGLLATTGAVNTYGSGTPDQPMAAAALAASGQPQAQPHENMAPFQALSYIIALFGIFPSRS